MKNKIIIGLILSILVACSKKDDFNSEYERLEGYWLLTEITGGIAGTGYEANFDHLQVNDGQRYSLMIQDAVLQEGTYKLSEEGDQLIIHFSSANSDEITFDNELKTVVFSDEDRKLTLADPCCDLYTYSFIREE